MNNINIELLIKDLKEQGFKDEQLVYFKPEHNKYQVEEIKKGIKLGIDVEKYCDPEYSAYQMFEILVGLIKGIDVDEYAYPNFRADKMRLIRICLERGIDKILEYKDLSYDELQLIVKCWFDDKDLTKYIDKNFSLEQLDEIAGGLQNNIDVSIYAKPEFTLKQMQEIRYGLQEELSIDVSIYAKPEFSGEQMEFLRRTITKICEIAESLSYSKKCHSYYDEMIKEVKAVAHPYYSALDMKTELKEILELKNMDTYRIF